MATRDAVIALLWADLNLGDSLLPLRAFQRGAGAPRQGNGCRAHQLRPRAIKGLLGERRCRAG
jgi:hypothetical protein